MADDYVGSMLTADADLTTGEVTIKVENGLEVTEILISRQDAIQLAYALAHLTGLIEEDE